MKNSKLGDKNGLWKGEEVGYNALHAWIKRKLGDLNDCQFCGTEISKRFVWHNINGLYKRKLTDWVYLCSKCHSKVHNHFDRWLNYKKSDCVICKQPVLAKKLCKLHYQHQYRGVQVYA